jgi:hypothetical protein
MKYFDPAVGADLETSVDRMVEAWADVTRTTMFGCPAYRAADSLFALLVTDGVVLTRLPEEFRPDVEAAFEAGPFVAGNRTINKWVRIRVESAEDVEGLRPFLQASYETALLEG